ncbi:MAG TPA: bifunctional diaminohydroxyphosphoribosylaminopyrimidine deaminase/5-amino-6-(5-phosphoribosylamino)uracil reductase RibD [Gemmatimonadales bacterium]|nr:bifunctional diaminohydroxyphosphoribosylaminopyrimidine deaminase/5-amino-6-(5-phosphoribosylamino)uracil reductase RibD [Gemmatimonadales bacterium]
MGGRAELRLSPAQAMRRALGLAWNGWGRVGGNPLVGAVVMRDGVVVGEGWHSDFGGPHAERVALAASGERSRGADLVVTLEPCRHHGKTPPCTDAIIAAGIRRVYFGAADVDPEARGGARQLAAAGIEVVGPECPDDVMAQNAAFFHRHRAIDRPFVTLKLAVSLDAKIADAHRRSRWLTGPEARAWVHWLRAGQDAIAVGLGTVLADDPELTVRGELQPSRTPLRVVFDRRAELPLDSKLARTARQVPTAIVAYPDAPGPRLEAIRAAGIAIVTGANLSEQLAALGRRGVGSLLVEGGGVLAGRMLEAELVDRLCLITAPVLLGGEGVSAFGELPAVNLSDARRWRNVGFRMLGQDTLSVMDRKERGG